MIGSGLPAGFASHVLLPPTTLIPPPRVGCTCFSGAAASVALSSSTGLAHPNDQAWPGRGMRVDRNCGRLTPRPHCEQAQFLMTSSNLIIYAEVLALEFYVF